MSNCDESNKPEARFCAKCKFVLSFDAFNDTIEEADKIKQELAELKAQQQSQREELEERLEDRIQANFERMQEEMLRMFGPTLKKIKNKKEQNNELSALLANADVLEEYDVE